MSVRITGLIALGALALCLGCGYSTTIEPPSQDAMSPTSMLRGTIWEGSVRDRALVQGLNPLNVRGFGLVVGLGTKGSNKVAPGVRSVLIKEMRRMRIGTGELGPMRITPSRMLDSKDTVVVRVSGNIPAGAVRGERFDVSVQALAGGEPVDLRGGRMYSAALAVYRGVSTGIAGSRPLAYAAGDVFVNPFSARDPESPATDLRLDEGVILNGGAAKVLRDLSIILQTSSYRVVRQIERRINDRFPVDPPIAKAKSGAKVALNLSRYAPNRRRHLLAVIGSIYLDDRPKFRQKKLAELIAALQTAETDQRANEIGIALEGLGRMALPQVRNLLTHSRTRVRFHAARTASRLGEVAPTEMFGLHAADPDSAYQVAAIEELGRITHDEKAASLLRKILPFARGGTRIAVYEALRGRSDHTIPTFDIAGRFNIDIIHDKGEPMIYATVRGEPRIAILGQNVRVKAQTFFNSDELGLTINQAKDRTGLESVREVHGPGGGLRFSPPMKSSHMAYSLVGALGRKVDPDFDEKAGLGFKYGQVVGVLYAMCRAEQINARFHLQRSPLPALDLYLPSEPTTRPVTGPAEPALVPADAPPTDGEDAPGKDLRDEAGRFNE